MEAVVIAYVRAACYSGRGARAPDFDALVRARRWGASATTGVATSGAECEYEVDRSGHTHVGSEMRVLARRIRRHGPWRGRRTAVVFHVGLNEMSGGQRTHQTELTSHDGRCDDAREPLGVCARRFLVGTAHA